MGAYESDGLWRGKVGGTFLHYRGAPKVSFKHRRIGDELVEEFRALRGGPGYHAAPRPGARLAHNLGKVTPFVKIGDSERAGTRHAFDRRFAAAAFIAY